MTALRAIFSRLGLGEQDDKAISASDDKRLGADRRQSERRSNVLPFQDREMRLRFAAKAAGFGTFDLDCTTGDNHWSPELKALAGLPQDNGPVPIDRMEQLVHPDDRERFMSRLAAAMEPQGNGDYEDEFRLVRPDGSQCWVRAKGRIAFIGSGQWRRALSATGIVMDITARRAAADAVAESRAELAGMVESAIDAIISIDSDQRIVLFNPAAARIFRCSAEDAIGSPLDRFIPEHARRAHRRQVERFSAAGDTGRTMGLPGVFSGRRADGEEFPIEASIAKVQVGDRLRLTVFLRDITERKSAEEALRRSIEDLEMAVRGAGIGIWNWDRQTDLLNWSERCYQLFGVPVGEPMNLVRFMAIVHPDDQEKIAASIDRFTQEGGDYKVECRVIWPNGSVHWVAAMGRDIPDKATGESTGMRGIALEITEQKRLEESLLEMNEALERRIEERTTQLVRANEALERSNLELQQFAFVAAHDLQTPLRSISGFAQLLQKDYRGRLDEQADAWLGQLVRSVHRMRDVINDILAYSRVESRGNAFRPTDFRQLFDDVVATLDAPIRETGARVTRDELPVVMGDRTQLAQVLQNLIDNAIKYYKGQETPQVHVSARRDKNEWLFSVRDNGIGIAEKHLEQIFDIFRRLHSQQEYPGTGIGLAVCRRVIHRHGGRIWVESDPGNGSVFYFTLPVGSKEGT